MDLKNYHFHEQKSKKTVLVIGGSSSIASALISKLVKEYDEILLTDVGNNYQSLLSEVELLEKQNKSKVLLTYDLDVSKYSEILEFEKILNGLQVKIDTFMYLAGINRLIPAIEVEEFMWDEIIDINLKGFFFISQLVAKNMIPNGGGNILGIASQHGIVANVNRAPYCASKAGMIHLAKQLAYEWGKYNIRVNVISPTMIMSEKNRSILENATSKKEYLRRIPLNKYAMPEDVAAAAMFVTSEEAKMITGHNLVLDGGWTIY